MPNSWARVIVASAAASAALGLTASQQQRRRDHLHGPDRPGSPAAVPAVGVAGATGPTARRIVTPLSPGEVGLVQVRPTVVSVDVALSAVTGTGAVPPPGPVEGLVVTVTVTGGAKAPVPLWAKRSARGGSRSSCGAWR